MNAAIRKRIDHVLWLAELVCDQLEASKHTDEPELVEVRLLLSCRDLRTALEREDVEFTDGQ